MIHHVNRAFLVTVLITISMVPYIDGIIVKYKYYDLVKAINQDNRLNIHIQILKYHRGWMTSQAKIRISINKKLTDIYPQATVDELAPISFVIDENIFHGPIVFDRIRNKTTLGYAYIESDISLSDAFQTLFPGAFKGTEIMRFDMRPEFDGDWAGQIQILPSSFDLKTTGNVTWDKIDDAFKIIIDSSRIKRVRNKLSIGTIKVEQPAPDSWYKQIIIQPIEYEYDVLRRQIGLWSGNASLRSSGFAITRKDNTQIIADQIRMYGAFSMDADTFYNTNFTINIDKLLIPDYFVPEMSQAQFTIGANNFSTHGINEYFKGFKSNVPPAFDFPTIERVIAHTVTPTSNIEGSILFNSPLGKFESHYKTTWDVESPAPNTLEDVTAGSFTEIVITASFPLTTKIVGAAARGFDQLLKELMGEKLAAITNIQIDSPSEPPKPPQPADQVVMDLVKINYISKDANNNYSTKLTIESGVPKINGRALKEAKPESLTPAPIPQEPTLPAQTTEPEAN